MPKTHVVVFTANNALVLTNPTVTPAGALVNPDLSLVKGVAPHYWKLSKGKIVPMNALERAARDHDHKINGVDNSLQPQKIRSLLASASALALQPLLFTALGVLLAHLIGV